MTFFQPMHKFPVFEEEMPGVETFMLFVKKEKEHLRRRCITLSRMKEGCQKPPHASSQKCQRH